MALEDVVAPPEAEKTLRAAAHESPDAGVVGLADLIGARAGRWWVLHTRPRHEKQVATALAERAVCHYLPLVHRRRVYGHRRIDVDLPLFPSYLFLYGDREHCECAQKTNRIVRILPVSDQTQIHRELDGIYRAAESGFELDAFPWIRVGRRCRVTRGALAGVEGVVTQRRGMSRLHLAATLLGQTAIVELDPALLEVID